MITTKKRFIAVVLCLVAMVSMLGITAYAANTTDDSFTVDCFLAISSHTDYRVKTNTSAVYCKWTKASEGSTKVNASVHGKINYGDWIDKNFTCLADGTYVDHVVCKVGTAYEIHSTAYENGQPNVCVWMSTGKTETLSGVWSPDCAGNYTDAAD